MCRSARSAGLWFRTARIARWYSPEELETAYAAGYCDLPLGVWEMLDPRVRIAELEKTALSAIAEAERMEQAMLREAAARGHVPVAEDPVAEALDTAAGEDGLPGTDAVDDACAGRLKVVIRIHHGGD